MLPHILSSADSTRSTAVLERLAYHGGDGWAITGGLAIGIHSVVEGTQPQGRLLNDLDFIAERFEYIPETLGKDFLFRHVHPHEQSGRTMMQLVDVDAKLRVDIFHAVGASMRRARQIELPAAKFKLVALEDLLARTARLLLDLEHDVSVPAKHAADFLLLSTMAARRDVQPAWRDHRKPSQPESFADARKILAELILKKRDLLLTPEYSNDAQAKCERCRQMEAFPLANPQTIRAVLGYC